MAKKQVKKSQKKEKLSTVFDPVSFGVIDAIRSQTSIEKPVFSNYQKIHQVAQAPMMLTEIVSVTPWFDRIMEILDDMAETGNSFNFNNKKIIHNNTMYDSHLRCKLKTPANEVIFQLWKNIRTSNLCVRFKKMADAIFEQFRSVEEDEVALIAASLLMNAFNKYILTEEYSTLSATLYGILYSNRFNPARLDEISEVWGGYKNLDEWILNEPIFAELFSKTKHFENTTGPEMISTLIAEKWLETAPDDEVYQKAVSEVDMGVNWEEIDVLKILPDVLNTVKNFHRYKAGHPRYTSTCPAVEMSALMTDGIDYDDMDSITLFCIPTQVSVNATDDVLVDDSMFKMSWDTMIQKTLTNSKSNMSIRFASDKYKTSAFLDGGNGIGDAIKNWGIPGLIKAVFPNNIFLSMINSILVADHFEFEVIYKGNADRLNDYAFNSNDELIGNLTPELYDEIYDYIRSEGNVLALNHRGHIMFMDENMRFPALNMPYTCDNLMYWIFEVRKIMQCIVDAHNYLKSKETDGSIDFYFEESEEVIHRVTKRRQIVYRRGSFVRGHYRHYKSGIVTLVRPHVRKGTNYIGEYVLEL